MVVKHLGFGINLPWSNSLATERAVFMSYFMEKDVFTGSQEE